MDAIKYETAVWEAAKARDGEAFKKLADKDAVMICGGFRLSGAEYAGIIKEFDCSSYEMSQFEVVFEDEEICQVNYVIETKVQDERNKDLEGMFQITSTWKKEISGWKLIFNMDSRVLRR